MKVCDVFGYANDFKLVSKQPEDNQSVLEAKKARLKQNIRFNENIYYNIAHYITIHYIILYYSTKH